MALDPMRPRSKQRGLMPKNCFKQRKGLQRNPVGFLLFRYASKVVKKVCEPHEWIKQRSKRYFGSDKGE
jgi:hypothetical protein